MYGMTEQFNEAILGDTRKFHTRIKSGELESSDSIRSVKSYSQMTSNSYITIGGAYSSYVTLELWNPGFTLENREFQLEIGLEFDNGEIEWCPIGKYTAESPKTSIDGMITLTAYDCIQSKLSGAFFSNLTYPTDAINVLKEIAQKTGVEIITTNLASGVVINSRKVVTNNEIDANGNAVEKVTYENPFNGYTYKEALGYIAMLYCKYAVTDENGAVVFKWYSEVTDYKITSDEFYDDFETSERAFAAGKITCNTGESELSAGSGENNIQLENPVMTQERLNYIYEAVKTLEFIPSLFSFYGDIRLEIGDVVKVEKPDGTIYSVPIMNISQDFDGGLKTSVQSYGGAEQENSTKSPLLNRLDRQYTELLLVKSLVGEKANFDYVYALSGEYKTLKADYGGFKELVTEDFEAVNTEIKNVKANNITTDNLDAALANIGVLTAVSADLKYATIQNLEALSGKFDALSAKAITTDNLSANVAVLGYATVDKLEAEYAKIATLETEYLKLNDLSAKVATLGYATIKQLEATDARIDKLNTQYASIDLANIDTANIDKAKVGLLFATMGLISTAVIENGHVTGYLDSVEVNANHITAGTLSVDRLIINGSDKSLIYALNNAGELMSTSVDTLDGGLLTDRTITADKLVAHSITANEITTSNIIGASGWINLAQGTFNYNNQISWDGKKLYIAPENIEIAISGKYSTIDYVDSSKESAIASAAIDATTKADAAQTAAIASAAADATSKADAVLKTAQSQIDSTNAVVATHTTTLSEHDTRITANENAISLKVWSKDVEEAVSTVDSKFASYSTTAEMQSAIEVAKSEINLSVSETYTTKAELSNLKTDVSNAKLGNLIKNGYGEYLNNTNFSYGIFTRGDCPEGCYGYFTYGTSDLIPFDPTSQYDLSFYSRRNANATDSDVAYFSIIPIDIDGREIGVTNVITDFDKNLYYLSKDLKDGDTVAYFTDLSKWRLNTSRSYQRRFLIFGYKDSTGYMYPDGTYSRYMYDNVYASDNAVDKVNNTITLTKAWSGGTVKAGTCIGHVTDGNTYCYYGQVGPISNTDWKKHSVRVYADAESENEKPRRLAYAKYIKLYLFNYKADYAGIHLSKTTIDADAQSKITSLETWKTEASQKITKDGIIATVGNYYAYQSDLDTAESRITQAETTIAQHTGEIALTVKEQDVTGNYIVGKLNLSSTTAKIAAKNIDLSGYVTVSSLKTAGATTIDGSNITTGTISADRIDAESLMAKKLTATNLTVTGNSVFSGTLSGATGDFTGKITATSGKIGNWNIDGSINATNANGNYIYLGAGINADQDVLFVRTGTDSSSYKWPIVLRATGEAIFRNATVTGNITATSMTAKNEYYIHASSGTGTKARALYAADGSIGSTLMVGDGFTNLHLCGLLVNKNSGQVLCGEDSSWGLMAGSVRAQGLDYGGQFNAVYGNYGVIFRNDGNAFYILLSNQGSPDSFNDLRPFIINLASGKVEVKTDFYCTNWGSGTAVRRPVASASGDGKQIQWIESKKNSSGTYYLTVNGQYGSSEFSSNNINCTTSDARLKTNVVDCNMDALSVINQIQVREFDWKESGIHQKIGFVADELEAIDSNLAFGGGYNEDGSMDVKSVNEFYLVGYLTKGIQELHTAQLSQANELLTLTARQDDQQVMIDYLLDENAALKKRVKELEKQIA